MNYLNCSIEQLATQIKEIHNHLPQEVSGLWPLHRGSERIYCFHLLGRILFPVNSNAFFRDRLPENGRLACR